MYLHLGNDVVVTTEEIIAMFDIDACTVSKKTRDFLALAQKRGQVVNVSYELPKSFVVCQKDGTTTVYISQLSTKTLSRREEKFSVKL
ncbi:MAG: extracellular matrix/biofilm biosynthesis regulator RemA family protein [Ruminococcus sp.]